MPDISLCRGGDCAIKGECYRFTAKPNRIQSYFVKPPLEDDGTCLYFWRKKKMRRKKAESK